MSSQELFTKDDVVWLVSPHADDELLGAGGILHTAKQAGARIYILYVVVSGFRVANGGSDSYLHERLVEIQNVIEALDVNGTDVLYTGSEYHLKLDVYPKYEILKWLEEQSEYSFNNVLPNIVLIPSEKHNHQDHRLVYEACLSLVRNRMENTRKISWVLSYEIPGTGQVGLPGFKPNLFIKLSEETLAKKCELFKIYKSQVAKPPSLRSVHAIKTLAQYRGMEAGWSYAEAYEVLRVKFNSEL
jgi:N-acetylglucosamine malate deacetylase 1